MEENGYLAKGHFASDSIHFELDGNYLTSENFVFLLAEDVDNFDDLKVDGTLSFNHKSNFFLPMLLY